MDIIYCSTSNIAVLAYIIYFILVYYCLDVFHTIFIPSYYYFFHHKLFFKYWKCITVITVSVYISSNNIYNVFLIFISLFIYLDLQSVIIYFFFVEQPNLTYLVLSKKGQITLIWWNNTNNNIYKKYEILYQNYTLSVSAIIMVYLLFF